MDLCQTRLSLDFQKKKLMQSCKGILKEIEVLEALKQMKNGSASGIDGITVNFSNYFGITSKRL